MKTTEARKVATCRLVQVVIIFTSVVLLGLGVVFGFGPYADLPAAIVSALGGTLLLALGLRGLDTRSKSNRARYDSHLATVIGQLGLLAGRTGHRQGMVLGDWGNARWRDLSEAADGSTYARLPILVAAEDVRWPVKNAVNINTGIPIDEIDGMDLTVSHLDGETKVLSGLMEEARRCLSLWRDFDSMFATRVENLASGGTRSPPAGFEVGWEQIPWFTPADGTWRIAGVGMITLSMTGEPQLDQPKFHSPGPGDLKWDVRLGDSSIWLLTGPPPVPDAGVQDDVRSVVDALRRDATLTNAYTTAVRAENVLRDRLNIIRRNLPDYPPINGQCPYCDSMRVLSPRGA
jgi:hypothetical protein